MFSVVNEIFPRFVEKMVALGIGTNGIFQGNSISEEHRELYDLQKHFYLFFGTLTCNNLTGVLRSTGKKKKKKFFYGPENSQKISNFCKESFNY
jgi:hypothetical protein